MPVGSLLTCLSLLAGTPAAPGKDAPPRDLAYRLVWSDEFDSGNQPNPKNWEFEKGFVRNRELQSYQQGKATCRDGFLVDYVRGYQKTRASRP